jgi:hypothetical protein
MIGWTTGFVHGIQKDGGFWSLASTWFPSLTTSTIAIPKGSWQAASFGQAARPLTWVKGFDHAVDMGVRTDGIGRGEGIRMECRGGRGSVERLIRPD